MKRYVWLLTIVIAGCAADGSGPFDRPMGHRETGTLIGAVGGAVVGAIAYDRNRTKGAVIGAVGGALAGGVVGRYMDDQRRDLEKNLSREIQSGQARVEKLANDVVRITMTNQTAFETDSSEIKPGFHSTMDKLADVVVRYDKTTLTVVGHTDNVGSNPYNQKLGRPVSRIEAGELAAARPRRQGRDPARREQQFRGRPPGQPPGRDLRRAGDARIGSRGEPRPPE